MQFIHCDSSLLISYNIVFTAPESVCMDLPVILYRTFVLYPCQMTTNLEACSEVWLPSAGVEFH